MLAGKRRAAAHLLARGEGRGEERRRRLERHVDQRGEGIARAGVSSLRTEDLDGLFVFLFSGGRESEARREFIGAGGGGDNAIGWGFGVRHGAPTWHRPGQWELGGLDFPRRPRSPRGDG
jgi:hypothetical protein